MREGSVTIDRNDNSLKKKRPRKPQPPPRYRVIYHNDDFTPMEFVMQLLTEIFHHPEDYKYKKHPTF